MGGWIRLMRMVEMRMGSGLRTMTKGKARGGMVMTTVTGILKVIVTGIPKTRGKGKAKAKAMLMEETLGKLVATAIATRKSALPKETRTVPKRPATGATTPTTAQTIKRTTLRVAMAAMTGTTTPAMRRKTTTTGMPAEAMTGATTKTPMAAVIIRGIMMQVEEAVAGRLTGQGQDWTGLDSQLLSSFIQELNQRHHRELECEFARIERG